MQERLGIKVGCKTKSETEFGSEVNGNRLKLKLRAGFRSLWCCCVKYSS